jgi:hypothetical protein
MSQFNNYSDAILDAFCLHNKRKEIIDRKQEIIDRVLEYYNSAAESVLFVGFNPAIFSTRAKEIYITEVSDRVFDWINGQGAVVKLLDVNDFRKFDIVIAFDEYLTFSDSEDGQKNLIQSLCKYATNLIITTVKDYKNQDFKDREYSQPVIIKSNNQLTAYTEIHDWDIKDKNVWTTALYQLNGMNSECKGLYLRRSLYFKQLAKFSMDFGATNFLVHKNLMYKSLIKKNYEHVISIQFEN